MKKVKKNVEKYSSIQDRSFPRKTPNADMHHKSNTLYACSCPFCFLAPFSLAHKTSEKKKHKTIHLTITVLFASRFPTPRFSFHFTTTRESASKRLRLRLPAPAATQSQSGASSWADGLCADQSTRAVAWPRPCRATGASR